MSLVPSSRHLHRKHIREVGSESSDAFPEEPRSILIGGGLPQQHHQPAHAPPDTALGNSTAVLSALEDSDSELARFLFCDSSNDGGDGDDKMRRIGSLNAAFYPLALEPLEIRNERVIMIFEGYAIFGALFMNAAWVIYEWGSANGDGDVDANVDRAFECIMAIALCSNTYLALYGAFCWMMSCMVDSSNEDYVFESREMLKFLHYLLLLTFWLVQAGLCIGIYKHLSPNLPEIIITLTIAILLKLVGETYLGRHMESCTALEYWHYPRWLQAMSGPPVLFERKELRARAKLRAQKLRSRAYCEGGALDPNGGEDDDAASRDGFNASSLEELLRKAAVRLGRDDLDVSRYQVRLEEDLFDDAKQLKGRSVECLCRYMPLRLAEEVHALVAAHET